MSDVGLKPLLHLLERVPPALADLSVRAVVADSRRVHGGELYFGLRGTQTAADYYVDAAFAAGALAAVVEDHLETLSWREGKPVWHTPEARALLGGALAKQAALTAQSVFVAGVTGTNGKSSVTHLLTAILPQPGFVVGTLGWGRDGDLHEQAHTTPDIESLHRIIADCRAQGAASIAMEVSSHALDQQRIAGVPVQLAVFTNLSRDHLDYHGDMEQYFAAKARLFTRPGLRYAVINADDPWSTRLLERLAGDVQCMTFGIERGDVRAQAIHSDAAGLAITVQTPQGECLLKSRWLGRVNAYNLLAALAAGLVLEQPLPLLLTRLQEAPPVPGRLQPVYSSGDGPLAVVDYAHTPDALRRVLEDLRQISQGDIWCVLGCGGERDRGKRPLMAGIAENLADWVVLTDDNPRHESAQAIMDEMLTGMEQPATAICVHDRGRAIALAIRAAREGDCVLIAGKGHERYQEYAGIRRSFNDVEAAQRAQEVWQ